MFTEDTAIREIFHHLKRYQGETFVFTTLDAGTVSSDDLRQVASDLGLMHALGINVVVCGSGESDLLMELQHHCKHSEFVNTPDVAHAARDLDAVKICLLGGIDTLTSSRRAIDDISVQDAEALLKTDDVTGADRAALAYAVRACRAGIPRVHVMNIHQHGAFLTEIFTGHGAGTMVYAGTHKEVRRTAIDDVPIISDMLQVFHPDDHADNYLRDHMEDSRVFVADGEVYGFGHVARSDFDLEVRRLVHTNRLNAPEVLTRLLKSFQNEAESAGLTVTISPDVVTAMRGQRKIFLGLGFKKRTRDGSVTYVWASDAP